MGTAICSVLHCLLNTFLGFFLWPMLLVSQSMPLLKGCVVNTIQCSFHTTYLKTMKRLSWILLSWGEGWDIAHTNGKTMFGWPKCASHTWLCDIHNITTISITACPKDTMAANIGVPTIKLANRLKWTLRNNHIFNVWYPPQRSLYVAESLYSHFGLQTRTDFSQQMILHPLLAVKSSLFVF